MNVTSPVTVSASRSKQAIFLANALLALPELVKSILTHEENIDINIDIERGNNLTLEQGNGMMRVIQEVLFKTHRLDELPTVLRDELKIDQSRAKKLALDLLGRRFLPLEFYLGPVQPMIKDLGGNPATYLAEAKKIWPEAYGLPPAADEEGESEPVSTAGWSILEEFEERMALPRGKEEILLRLTGVSAAVDEQARQGSIAPADAEKITAQLDQLGYIINTHDLNSFEIQSIKRRLARILRRAMPS